jgi:tetratricopeptide (TPR) repeat protein
MSYKDEIIDLIKDSQAEINRDKVNGYLLNALVLAEKYAIENPMDGANEKAYILKELALEESKTDKRNLRWKEALFTLEKAIKQNLSYQLVEAYSYLVVDSVQDEFSGITTAQQTNDLRTAYSFIEQCLKKVESSTQKSILLSRKSSIIRYLAFKELTNDLIKLRLEESLRCAELATRIHATGFSYLELALCEWAIANYEDSDESYSQRLKDTEKHLRFDLLKDDENALLTLVRFYRQNALPQNCCEVFPKTIDEFKNIRKLLRSVYLYAEAAISLWYSKYPVEIVNKHLNTSRGLLEIAISAGYNNARNIVDLAYIQSIQGSVEDGNTTLNEVNLEGNMIDWALVMDKIHNPYNLDALFSAFVLGIDNCGVWTRLGTYAKMFMEDIDLSESMYRAAIRIDPRNPIALTNLARLLVNEYDDEESLSEAKRVIQKASNYANKRFCWWRQVLHQIEEYESNGTKLIKAKNKPYVPITEKKISNIKQVKKKYFEVSKLESPQERGRELEKLFYELAKLTFPVAESPYNFNRMVDGTYQIDGYFKLDSDRYRVECKWHSSENVDSNEITIFANKLDAFGVAGILISMTDFSSVAVGEARKLSSQKPILLINGTEMEKVFVGEQNLDQLIQVKRAHFDKSSNPYWKVSEFITD